MLHHVCLRTVSGGGSVISIACLRLSPGSVSSTKEMPRAIAVSCKLSQDGEAPSVPNLHHLRPSEADIQNLKYGESQVS